MNFNQQFQQQQRQQQRQRAAAGYAWQQQQKLRQRKQQEDMAMTGRPVRRRNEFFSSIKAVFMFIASLIVPGCFFYGGGYFVTLALTDSEDLAMLAFYAGAVLALIVASINANTVYKE